MYSRRNFRRMVGLGATSLLMTTMAPNAMALTASGTSIANTATVNYNVNSVAQTAINASSTTIVVDAKVDLTVAGTGGNINVTPGANGQILRFTVLNTGNETFDYGLTFVASTTDNFDATGVTVYVDRNGNNVYDAGTDTTGDIDNLTANSTVSVFVVGNIPLSPTNGQQATYKLVATTKLSDGSAVPAEAADAIGTKQYVYADADGDAAGSDDASQDTKHSASLTYNVATSTLTVTKSSSVIWDPVNGNVGPLHIPGAIVEYTISISNGAGGATATSISVTDILDTNLNIAPNQQTGDPESGAFAAGKSVRVTAPDFNGSTATNLDLANATYVSGQTVTVSAIALAGGESATVKIRAEIK